MEALSISDGMDSTDSKGQSKLAMDPWGWWAEVVSMPVIAICTLILTCSWTVL